MYYILNINIEKGVIKLNLIDRFRFYLLKDDALHINRYLS